jgi:hypothetical protein
MEQQKLGSFFQAADGLARRPPRDQPTIRRTGLATAESEIAAERTNTDFNASTSIGFCRTGARA